MTYRLVGIKREDKACILFIVIVNRTAHNKNLQDCPCDENMKRHLRVIAKNENVSLSTVHALNIWFQQLYSQARKSSANRFPMKVNPHTTKGFSLGRISLSLPAACRLLAPQAKQAINRASNKGPGELMRTPQTAQLAPKAGESNSASLTPFTSQRDPDAQPVAKQKPS